MKITVQGTLWPTTTPDKMVKDLRKQYWTTTHLTFREEDRAVNVTFKQMVDTDEPWIWKTLNQIFKHISKPSSVDVR